MGSVLGIFLLVRFLRTAAGHYAFDRLTLKLPLFSKLSKGINAARFASTLSILTKSGVPLVDALKIGAAVSNNWVIRDSVNLAAEKVTEGGNLATQLERSGYQKWRKFRRIGSYARTRIHHARSRSHNPDFNLIGTFGTIDVGVYGQHCFGDCDCSDASNRKHEQYDLELA